MAHSEPSTPEPAHPYQTYSELQADLDHYRGRVDRAETQLTAIAALADQWRGIDPDAARSLLEAMFAEADRREGAWETQHVHALEEPLRVVLTHLTPRGAS